MWTRRRFPAARRFLKKTGYLLAVMLLLPYVVTVCVNGNGMGVSQEGTSPYVTVKSDGKRQQLSLDEYGIGVLAREMDPEAGEEAVKAQAVLIRTSIYKSIQEEGSDTVLTLGYWTRSQMKKGWGGGEYGRYYEKMKMAWEETEGQVLLYNGSLALTPYHRLSSGKTRSAAEALGTEEYPYLQVRDCPADVEAEGAMSTSFLQTADMEVTKTDSAGYVTEVRCGQETVGGEEFRDTYHLASACFTLQEFEGQIRVTVKGVGHGLGMSQYTAAQMASEGKSCEEILQYFFEGTSLEKVAEILVKPE